MSTYLRAELAEYGRRQRAERRPVDIAEILASVDADPASLDGSIDNAVHPVEIELDGPRGDALLFDSRWRVDESTAGSERKRWLGVLTAAAVTVLVVAGAIVMADRDVDEVEPSTAQSPGATDLTAPQLASPVTLPSVDDSVPSSERRGVTEDPPVFGEPDDQIMNSVTVGGPGLVAVGIDTPNLNTKGSGSAAVWTSVDGFTWSRVPYDEAIFGTGGVSMLDVTVGGPGLVAVGGYWPWSDAVVWTSVDGLIWSRVAHDEAIFGNATMNSVTAGGPGLVAVGTVHSDEEPDGDDADAAAWTSIDGITWSRVPHNEAIFGGADEQFMDKVIVGGPGLVAVGSDGMGTYDHHGGRLVAAVWTSEDGFTWSRVPHDDAIFGRRLLHPDEGPAHAMTSVTAGGPGLVAVGWDGYNAGTWTSVDGLTWSRVPHDESLLESPVGRIMLDVTAGGPGLVAVGPARVWTSVDGITWSLVPDRETLSGIGSVISAGSGLVAVGGDEDGLPVEFGFDAKVWTSVDGITWSQVTHDEATNEAD